MRQAEAPFRQSGGLTIRPDVAACELTALLRRSKGFALLAGYCLGSGAANTLRQAAGIFARGIGGFGLGGVFLRASRHPPTLREQLRSARGRRAYLSSSGAVFS